MPLPVASEADVSLLSANMRVLVHTHHVLEVARIDGDPSTYRVSVLGSVIQLFRDREINFPRTQWDFPNQADAENFARDTALVLYNQFKALDDVSSAIGAL